MISGNSSGELASHTGHGFTSYTWATESKKKNNFTSAGTRHVYQLTREGNHWNLTRNTGDVRGSRFDNDGRGAFMQITDAKGISFRTFAEAKRKAKVLPESAASNLKSALRDYSKRNKGKGSSGRSSG